METMAVDCIRIAKSRALGVSVTKGREDKNRECEIIGIRRRTKNSVNKGEEEGEGDGDALP